MIQMSGLKKKKHADSGDVANVFTVTEDLRRKVVLFI